MDFLQIGIIGPTTWNKIVDTYNGLQSEVPEVEAPPYPGYLIRVGSSGSNVLLMQRYLNMISNKYPSIPKLTEDGVFGSGTQSAVAAFQREFGLSPDRNNWTFNMECDSKRSK